MERDRKNFIKKGTRYMYQNQQQNPYGYYNTQPQTYYPRTSGIPQNPQMLLKGRPVSSIEEVKATPIDFDVSIFLFPDISNKRIYTKQVGMDGSAILQLYELKEIPFSDPIALAPDDFVTRNEFNEVISQLKQALTPIAEAVAAAAAEKEKKQELVF